MTTFVRWTFVALFGLTVIVLALAGWLLGTHQGSRWALERVPEFVPVMVNMEGIEGSFAAGLRLHRLSVRGDGYSLELDDIEVAIDWGRSLLVERLALGQVSVVAVRITTTPGDTPGDGNRHGPAGISASAA